MADVATIRETVQRAADAGLPLSEYALRLLIKQGRIPCRRAGRTQLVYWPNVVNWLTCADGADNLPEPQTADKIRRIS